MKSIILGISLSIALIFQLFFLQTWQTEAIVANVVLSFIVVASLYTTFEQILWLSLFAGLFSDIYSSMDFGFYLGFYLLVAIIAKYFLKFGETEHSWWRPIVFIAVCAFIQSIVTMLPLYQFNSFWTVTNDSLRYVVFTIVAGVVWYLLFAQINDFIKNITKSKSTR